MGKWSNSTDEGKGKPLMRVTVPVMVNEENLERLELAVTEAPDSFEAELTNISASSGVADVTIIYTGKGGDINDVKRMLERAGIPFVTKRPSKEKLEG